MIQIDSMLDDKEMQGLLNWLKTVDDPKWREKYK